MNDRNLKQKEEKHQKTKSETMIKYFFQVDHQLDILNILISTPTKINTAPTDSFIL